MLDQSQDQYQAAIVKTVAMRTQSDPAADPLTSAGGTASGSLRAPVNPSI